MDVVTLLFIMCFYGALCLSSVPCIVSHSVDCGPCLFWQVLVLRRSHRLAVPSLSSSSFRRVDMFSSLRTLGARAAVLAPIARRGQPTNCAQSNSHAAASGRGPHGHLTNVDAWLCS